MGYAGTVGVELPASLYLNQVAIFFGLFDTGNSGNLSMVIKGTQYIFQKAGRWMCHEWPCPVVRRFHSMKAMMTMDVYECVRVDASKEHKERSQISYEYCDSSIAL